MGARTVASGLRSTARKRDNAIEDEFSQAIARRIEDRGIATVPGLPREDPPQWYDLVIEHSRRMQAFEVEREERHKAEKEAEERAAMSTPDLVRAVMADTGTRQHEQDVLPLNGNALLSAAQTAVSNGENNRHTHESISDVIRRSLVQDGRNE